MPSMSKKHFEFLADWIARNTQPAGRFTADQTDLRPAYTALALALITFDGNERFDRARFEARIAELAGRYV